MDYNFSKLSDIPDSPTLSVNAMAQQLISEGQDVVNMSAGIPQISPYEEVMVGLESAFRENRLQYPPVTGYPELRELFSNWFNVKYNSAFSDKNCLITTGGKHSLYLAIQTFVDTGDDVMVVTPYWVSYPQMIKLNGGNTVFVETSYKNNWKVTPQDLENKLTKKSKLLIINNASNPTGVLYSKEELEKILKFAKKHNLIVISDEVYSTLTYEREFISCASFEEYKDRVIVVHSASKMFALTGLRVGFILANEVIINKAKNIQAHETAGTSSVSQYAVLECLNNSENIIDDIRSKLKGRRDKLYKGLMKLGNVQLPDSAMYFFVPISLFTNKESRSEEFCIELLKEKGIASVPGKAFGHDEFIRLSFGVDEETINKFLDRI